MKLTLLKRTQEVSGVETFTFTPEGPLTWEAGQYLHYTLPHQRADDRGVERWFTISSAPFEATPAITTRHASEHGSSFKEALFALRPGDSIEADGLEGDFVVKDNEARYVFLAGGIGITPFHSILKEADHAGTKLLATLIYANRDEQAPYKSELDSFAAHNEKFSVHYLTAPQKIDEQCITGLIADLQESIFYVSGPEPMVKSLSVMLGQLGVPEAHIRLDDFPGYEQY